MGVGVDKHIAKKPIKDREGHSGSTSGFLGQG